MRSSDADWRAVEGDDGRAKSDEDVGRDGRAEIDSAGSSVCLFMMSQVEALVGESSCVGRYIEVREKHKIKEAWDGSGSCQEMHLSIQTTPPASAQMLHI